MRHPVALFLAALAAVCLLARCGGDDRVADPAAAPAPSVTRVKRDRVDNILDEVRKDKPLDGLAKARKRTRHEHHRFRRTALAQKIRAEIEPLFDDQVLVVEAFDGEITINYGFAGLSSPTVDRRVISAQMSETYQRVFQSGLSFKRVEIGAYAPGYPPPKWAALLGTSINRNQIRRNPEIERVPELRWKIDQAAPGFEGPRQEASTS